MVLIKLARVLLQPIGFVLLTIGLLSLLAESVPGLICAVIGGVLLYIGFKPTKTNANTDTL